MVDDDSDVLMPPLIAGFIDADLVKIIQTALDVRFEILPCPADAAAYRFPVNPHVVGNGTSVELSCHPGNGHIKPLGEAGARISPGNILAYNTMNGAFNTVPLHSQIDQNPAKVEIPPDTLS